MPLDFSHPALAASSVNGSGGTIIVDSSGSNSSVSPGGITTSSTTRTIYYNGWPIQEVVPVYYVYTPEVVTGNPAYSNEPCLAVSTSSPIYSYSEAYQLQFSAAQTWSSLAGTYPNCTYASQESSAKAHLTPVQEVTNYWDDTVQNELPVPQFTVPPGFALTGLPAFLTANCNTSISFYDTTPIGTADIQATGELWVKWDSNDGWSGPYSSCGLPWPNGTISHVYENKGSATVSIKETWSASWTLAGASGTLSGLFTSPGSLTLPISSITSEIYS
ncbi:MAG: hypothetical protein EPN30_04350 [Actinomycetota bacterium]|nr:MAG: hypothetical protein EPN30_04350 [Actinomycetota bacterium]